MLTIDPEAGQWRGTARQLLIEAGRRIGMEPTEFYGQSSALARVLAPIGLAQAATPGRLRTLIDELREFRDSIINWGQSERMELAATAGYAGELAGLTADRATDILAQLDKRIAQEGWILRNWKQEAIVVAAISNRVSWMLDGWEHIIPLWSQVHGEPIDVQRETVGQLIPLLPVFPRSEAMETPSPAPPQNSPARTARPDFEVTARLEAAKSRTMRK